MPAQLPSSFASAAAGQSNRDSRGGGRDGRGNGSGEWARRDGRPTNGTMTFRRSSTTPSNSQSNASQTALPPDGPLSQLTTQTLPPLQTPTAEVPHGDGTLRYSREQLLDISKATESGGVDLQTLFLPGWNPLQVNGHSARSWGKSNENHVSQDPTVCWDMSGGVKPIGLQGMTPEEKELFNSDVNSPVKPPQQNKDGGHQGGGMGGLNGRKASVSHGTTFPLSSPSTASRPGTRRRETGDTNPFPGGGLTSPTGGRFFRDDPSSWFGRRSLDDKDAAYDDPEDELMNARDQPPTRSTPFGTISRSSTGNTAGVNTGFAAASSLWAPTGQASPGGSAMGSFGNFALPTSSTIGDKRFGLPRGESRLAHLIPKDSGSPADGSSTPKGNEAAGSADAARSWRHRPRTDTDPFGEDGGNAGSLRQDGSPPPMPQHPQRSNAFETPVKPSAGSAGDYGMAGLNLGAHPEEAGSPQTNPYRSPPVERGEDDAGVDHGLSHAHGSIADQSGFGSISRGFPPTTLEGSDRSQTSSVGANKGFPSLGNLAGWPSGLTSATPDRERGGFTNPFGSSLFSPDVQSSGGLGGVGGMFSPASASTLGQSGSLRGTSKLGSLFPPALQSQMQGPSDHDNNLSDSLPDLRQANPLGAIGRGGAQARDTDSPLRAGRGVFDDLFPSVSSSMAVSDATRTQGIFSTADQAPSLTSLTSPLATTQAQSFAAATSAPTFPSLQASAGDAPPPQNRTMVMPDRMRWIYLDPQGQTQGPFTGLEMNDWYKANFFTPDLRVKRIEDDDFEPLGQLIRRIGNSREPFLVPQIGVPHGPPSNTGPFASADSRGGVIPPLVNAFPSFGRTLTAEEQNNLERRKQEEQFMLHRHREMLAQQQVYNKIALQAGAPAGVLHHHSSAHSLQSQPSFGSISSPIAMPPQSALSALGPSGPGAAPHSFFEHSSSQALGQPGLTSAPPDFLRDDLNLQERQMLSSLQSVGGVIPVGIASQRASAGATQPPVPGTSTAAPSTIDASLRSQLPGVDQLQPDSQGFSARLKEFQEIRAQRDAEEAVAATAAAAAVASTIAPQPEPIAPNVPEESLAQVTGATTQFQEEEVEEAESVEETPRTALEGGKRAAAQSATLSLTQHVQKAQAAAAAAKQVLPEEPSWLKQPLSTGLPMPFPPPPAQLGTPLAAPTAQRTRSTLPDQYAASRSQSATPENLSASQMAPPPLAPWAKDPAESQKGPNFREIQEAEAKKAQRAELAAMAARRAALEQEAIAVREREKAASAGVAPLLPTTSTWGNGSPVATSSATSPWARPGTASKGGATSGQAIGSASAAPTGSEKKRTIAEIQREEEARKQRLAKAQEQAAAASAASATGNMGKRYADLASKGGNPLGPGGPGATASVAAASGWTTVSAGGKVKVPTGPSAPQVRAVSTGNVKPVVGAAAAASVTARPVVRPIVTAQSKPDAAGAAMEEFNKWLRRELGRGITGGIDIDTFASTLLVLPLDQTIISEAVYANSTTMDGRHFAEEFVRRKKLADKGVVEKQPTGGRSNTGASGASSASGSDNKGWSEVAKKNSSGNNNNTSGDNGIQGAGFKVVPGRKRGKK